VYFITLGIKKIIKIKDDKDTIKSAFGLFFFSNIKSFMPLIRKSEI
jgi:hypothetical protein